MISKEVVGQGHFRVTKYKKANYIALNLPYYYRFSFVCSSMGHKRDHILSHCLFTIHKMGVSICTDHRKVSFNCFLALGGGGGLRISLVSVLGLSGGIMDSATLYNPSTVCN